MKAVSNAVIAQQLANLADDIKDLKTTLDQCHRAMYGNGDTEKGLCARLGVVETVTSRLEKALWLVVTASVTAIVGAIIALLRTGG